MLKFERYRFRVWGLGGFDQQTLAQRTGSPAGSVQGCPHATCIGLLGSSACNVTRMIEVWLTTLNTRVPKTQTVEFVQACCSECRVL